CLSAGDLLRRQLRLGLGCRLRRNLDIGLRLGRAALLDELARLERPHACRPLLLGQAVDAFLLDRLARGVGRAHLAQLAAGIGRIGPLPLDFYRDGLRAPMAEALPDLAGLDGLLELELTRTGKAQLVLIALGRIRHYQSFPFVRRPETGQTEYLGLEAPNQTSVRHRRIHHLLAPEGRAQLGRAEQAGDRNAFRESPELFLRSRRAIDRHQQEFHTAGPQPILHLLETADGLARTSRQLDEPQTPIREACFDGIHQIRRNPRRTPCRPCESVFGAGLLENVAARAHPEPSPGQPLREIGHDDSVRADDEAQQLRARPHGPRDDAPACRRSLVGLVPSSRRPATGSCGSRGLPGHGHVTRKIHSLAAPPATKGCWPSSPSNQCERADMMMASASSWLRGLAAVPFASSLASSAAISSTVTGVSEPVMYRSSSLDRSARSSRVFTPASPSCTSMAGVRPSTLASSSLTPSSRRRSVSLVCSRARYSCARRRSSSATSSSKPSIEAISSIGT